MNTVIKTKEEWEKEFDQKISELKRDGGTEEIYEFGYRTITTQNEIYTIPDWGNVKSFIRTLLSSQKEQFATQIIKALKGEKWSIFPEGEWNRALSKAQQIVKNKLNPLPLNSGRLSKQSWSV